MCAGRCSRWSLVRNLAYLAGSGRHVRAAGYISREFAYKVTDAVNEELVAWRNRPLDRIYPVVSSTPS